MDAGHFRNEEVQEEYEGGCQESSEWQQLKSLEVALLSHSETLQFDGLYVEIDSQNRPLKSKKATTKM